MNIGDTFQNFTAKTTIGEIDLYNWLGDRYKENYILFFNFFVLIVLKFVVVISN